MPAAPSATVAGLVARLLPDYPPLDPATRAAAAAEVAAHVADQLAALPPYLRLPVRLALAAFAWLPLLVAGRPFAALPPARQATWLGWWSAAPLAPARDVVRLVRSVALLAWFDHPAVRARLEAEE